MQSGRRKPREGEETTGLISLLPGVYLFSFKGGNSAPFLHSFFRSLSTLSSTAHFNFLFAFPGGHVLSETSCLSAYGKFKTVF